MIWGYRSFPKHPYESMDHFILMYKFGENRVVFWVKESSWFWTKIIDRTHTCEMIVLKGAELFQRTMLNGGRGKGNKI